MFSIVIINRLRCDHNSLKSSLFRFKITNSDKCSCGLIEDRNYIYYGFAISLPKKERMLDKFNKLNIKAPIDIKKIIKKNENE